MRYRYARKHEALLVLLLAKRADISGQQFASRGRTPRRQIAAIYVMQCLLCTPPRSATSLAREASRRPSNRYPPCVVRSPALAAHENPGLCVLYLPAIGAFQRHSTQHVLRCRSFRSSPAPAVVPFGCVQRTGCSACGLGYPHQVLVGFPYVIYPPMGCRSLCYISLVSLPTGNGSAWAVVVHRYRPKNLPPQSAPVAQTQSRIFSVWRLV
jgi:hypothetical protein